MPVVTISSQIEAARIWAAERADAYRRLDDELHIEEEIDEDMQQNPYPDSPVYDDDPNGGER